MNAPRACDIVQTPSPNCGERRGERGIDLLLLHYTATKSADNALKWLCNPEAQASAHYLIDEDGSIYQMVAEEQRAWHAGASFWAGDSDINSCSIGIEIQNEGVWGGNPNFPETQMDAVERLCLDILDRHSIPPERVLAHSDVAPGRKVDPGAEFDWKRLHLMGIGHWVEPAALCDDRAIDLGDEGDAVLDIQNRLISYGYKLEASGLYDAATKTVMSAFQLHFRQQIVDGVADHSSIETLKRLAVPLSLQS